VPQSALTLNTFKTACYNIPPCGNCGKNDYVQVSSVAKMPQGRSPALHLPSTDQQMFFAAVLLITVRGPACPNRTRRGWIRVRALLSPSLTLTYAAWVCYILLSLC